MTGDEFRDRYQILKRVTAGEISTFLARSRAGDRVMVHVLRTPPEETRDLLARVARLTGSRDRRVREVTRHRGTDVVVTDFLDDFESLDGWLPELGTAREGPAGEERPEGSPSEDAGEFTRLFEAPEAGEEDRGTAGETGSETDREDPGDDRPGEFTRLFEVEQEGEASRESPAEGRGVERPGPEGGAERPERTPSGGETPGPAPEAGDGPPGERASERGGEEPREAAEEPAPAGEEDRGAGTGEGGGEAPGQGPGEFTRLFEAHGPAAGSSGEGEPDEAEAPSDRAGRPTEGREGTGPAEASSSPGAGEPDGPEEGPGGPPDERDGEGEPGEFTRMFGSPSATHGPAGEEASPPAGEEPDVGTDEAEKDAASPPEGRRTAGSGTEPAEGAEEPATSAGSAGRPSRTGGDGAGSEEEPAADTGPGEFTRMFGSPDTPSDDLPASAASGGRGPGGSASGAEGSDDYLERLGDAGSSRSGSAGPDPTGGAGAGPPEDGGEEGGGPGRYTRMIERPSGGSGAADEGASEPATGRTGGSPFDPAPASEGGTEPESGEERGSRTVYLAALGGVLLVAVVLVIVLVLVAGGGEEGSEPSETDGDEPAATTETSALPGEHDEQLQFGVREVGRYVDGEVPRLTDGGPVLA